MLIDTNALIRTLQPNHAHYFYAERAIRLLPEELHIVPQNLFEIWVVATRRVGQNGLGLTASQAAIELHRLKKMFKLLRDTQGI